MITRRDLLRASAGAIAGLSVAGALPPADVAPALHLPRRGRRAPRIRFAAIGLNHGHIYGQVDTVIRGGGELVAFHAAEPELAAAFARRYPAARQARGRDEIL